MKKNKMILIIAMGIVMIAITVLVYLLNYYHKNYTNSSLCLTFLIGAEVISFSALILADYIFKKEHEMLKLVYLSIIGIFFIISFVLFFVFIDKASDINTLATAQAITYGIFIILSLIVFYQVSAKKENN